MGVLDSKPVVKPPKPPKFNPDTDLRSFGDAKQARKRIYDDVLHAAQNIQPLQNQRHTLRLRDVNYAEEGDFDLAAQKQAVLTGKTLGRRLVGTWELSDNETGNVLDKKTATIARVPHMTDRGTFIHNGSEYTVSLQQRLRPGIYTRIKDNGEIESHCLHGTMKIWTEIGMLPIRKIVNEKLQLRVWSYDFETEELVLRPITNWFRNPVKTTLGRATYEAKGRLSASLDERFHPTTLWATPEHNVFLPDGTKKEISTAKKLTIVEEQLSDTQQQLILGSLLGDAHVTPAGLYQEAHCDKQYEYIRLKEQILLPILRSGLKIRQRDGKKQYWLSSKSARFLHFARELCFPNNIKTVSNTWLDLLDERALAFWFCDDGCTCLANNGTSITSCRVVVLATDGFTYESVELLIQWLERRWGIEAYTTRNSVSYGERNLGWAINISGDDAERFLDIIAPFVHQSLRYKLGSRPPAKHCRHCDKEISSRRKECNACCLAQYRLPGERTKGNALHRFGGAKAVHELLRTGEIPVEHCLTERWDRRNLRVGNQIERLLDDIDVTYRLTTVPCNFQTNQGLALEETKTAYDIEVEGTHNYFANGILVSNCNVISGKGWSHRYFLDPAKGIFYARFGQANIPVMPLLKSLGAKDKDLQEAWGNELWSANMQKDDPATLNKLYQKLIRKADLEAPVENKRQAIKEAIEKMEMDPDVNQQTLGHPYSHLGLDSILATTKKLLSVSKGESDIDDRDHLAYQNVYGPEDLFSERIARDFGGLRRNLFFKSSFKGNLNPIQPSALTKQLEAVLISSGLGQPGDEINLAETLDKQHKITRMGVGGIGSEDSVPEESRSVSPSHLAYIDALKTPESGRAGVDLFMASAARKGVNGRIYAPFINIRTNQIEWKSPQDLVNSAVTYPGELNRPTKRVGAMIGGKLKFVHRNDVEYVLPNFENAFTPLSNLVPMKSAIKGQRSSMASRMITQALPLEEAEAPFVQSGVPGEDGVSYEDKYGGALGAVRADKAGTVVSVDPDHIQVKYDDGSTEVKQLYNNFPNNRKTPTHNTPLIQAGQRFLPGQMLAKSNYTDNNGTVALGRNLYTAYIPYKGWSYEDASVISESAAKKLTSQHMYQHGIDWTSEHKQGKNPYVSLFPSKYPRNLLDKMDADGVIKKGETINFGEPLILAARQQSRPYSKVHKKREAAYTDQAETWDHESAGVVTDVIKTPKGVTVVVKSSMPFQEGDKMSPRHGDKTIVSKILPDDQMPKDSTGRPYEVLLNPLVLISRGNSAQAVEAALGKITAKTGKPYKVQDFHNIPDLMQYALDELQKHKMSDTEDVTDAETGRKIPNILTGYRYFMKLHHQAESKGQGRGTGGYTMDATPARGGASGSKSMSLLESNALLAHGAYETIRDAGAIRGQRNEEFWLPFLQGHTPPKPKIPLVYTKFLNELKAAGINVVQHGPHLQVMALTDKDVDKLAEGRYLENAETVHFEKDMKPVKGGLFDQALFGQPKSGRWAAIKLTEPMLNPVFEEPARRILGLTQKDLEAVIAGKKDVNGFTGPAAIHRALDGIDVDKELALARENMKSSRRTYRDEAVRKIGYLKAAKRLGIHPRDWVLSKVPVLPPMFRPVSVMSDSKLPLISDPNYMYKELVEANNNLADMKTQISDVSDERLALYNSFKAVTGLGDPIHPKLQEKRVKGILKAMLGSSPKFSELQRRLISSHVDLVGRAVVTPNPALDMDHVGLPEDKAWGIYKNFIVRRLKRRGMSLIEAAKHVENRTDVARRELINEIATRPVVINRAPVLHKFGIMSAFPTLVKGNTLQVSPLITKGFNMDFDGDMLNYHVPVSDEAKQEAIDRLLPSRNLLSPADFNSPVHTPGQEFTGGLYAATTNPSKRRAQVFRNIQDVLAAYRRGELEINDPVEVLS